MDPNAGGFLSSIAGNLTNTTTSPQTSNFTITGSANGCPITPFSVSVIVNPPPTVAAITGPNSVCTGSTIQLLNATTGGTWSSNNTSIASVNSSTGLVTGVASGAVVITYTVINAATGCKNSVTMGVSVNPTPTITATANPTTICAGGTSQLTASGLATASSTLCFTNNTQTGFQCCGGVVYQNVTVSGIPAGATITGITLTANVNHQRDQEVALYLLAPGGSLTGGPYPYSTSGQAITLVDSKGGTGSNFINTVFSDAGVVMPPTGAPYTGTYQPVNSFASLITAIGVASNANGTWRFGFLDHINSGYTGVFQNYTLCITYTTVTGGTYSWSPATNLSSTTIFNPIANPDTTTTYSVTGSASNGCSGSSNVTVNVSQPVIANAGPDQANCNSGGFTLAGNSPSPGTGVWSVVSGTVTITTPSSPNSTVTNVPVGGTATLRWTITNGACISSDDIVLRNYALPATPTSVTATPASICAGASSNLKAISSGNTIYWYTVSTGGTNIGTSASGANFSVTPAITTTYYAEAYNSASGCVSATRTAVTVTVTALPAAPTAVTATPASICAGASSNLNATSAGNTIRWFLVATGGANIGTSASGANFAVTPASTTTYYAEAYTATGCASSTRTPVTVTVTALPAAPTAVTATPASICAGASSNLNATSAGNTIRWYTVASGGVNIGTSASGANFAVTPASTTTYYAEAYTASGCVSTTRTAVTVTVTAIPAAPTSVTATPASICAGASSNLNATSAGNTIRWYTVASGGVNIGTSASGANFAVTPASTTT
ncbi:MAG: hypothetical protein JST17_00220, partial [Bacteroidetes bacterium]|nr:hypothetical protein [Bacteroidota bacterium]